MPAMIFLSRFFNGVYSDTVSGIISILQIRKKKPREYVSPRDSRTHPEAKI